MNRKKTLLLIMIAVTLLLALCYSYGFFRLDIIRESLEWDLPGWLQALIWGW